MTLLAEAVAVTNGNPGVAALVGGAIGGAFAATRAVRRAWKREGEALARRIADAVVEEHARSCDRLGKTLRSITGEYPITTPSGD